MSISAVLPSVTAISKDLQAKGVGPDMALQYMMSKNVDPYLAKAVMQNMELESAKNMMGGSPQPITVTDKLDMATGAGLDSIPTPERGFADGGIVAFTEGGDLMGAVDEGLFGKYAGAGAGTDYAGSKFEDLGIPQEYLDYAVDYLKYPLPIQRAIRQFSIPDVRLNRRQRGPTGAQRYMRPEDRAIPTSSGSSSTVPPSPEEVPPSGIATTADGSRSRTDRASVSTPSGLGDMKQFLEGLKPKELNDYVKQAQKAAEEAGIGNAAAQFKQFVQQRQEELGKDRKGNKKQAIIEGSLALIEASSQPGAANVGLLGLIGRGAAEGVRGYQARKADIRKSEDELRKAQFELGQAEENLKLGITKEGQAKYDAAQQTYNNAYLKMLEMQQEERMNRERIAAQREATAASRASSGFSPEFEELRRKYYALQAQGKNAEAEQVAEQLRQRLPFESRTASGVVGAEQRAEAIRSQIEQKKQGDNMYKLQANMLVRALVAGDQKKAQEASMQLRALGATPEEIAYITGGASTGTSARAAVPPDIQEILRTYGSR